MRNTDNQHYGCRNTTLPFLFVIIASSLFLSMLAEGAEASAVTSPYDRTVDEGQNAYYYVRVLNNDHPAGVDIVVKIEQNISDFEAKNQEFSLSFMQYDYTYITVHTRGVREREIHTTVHVLERGMEDSDFREIDKITFNTTVRHTEESGTGSNVKDGFSLLLTGAALSAALGLGYYAYSRGIFSFPALRGYTKLNNNTMLKNRNRKLLYTIINDHPEGISFSQLKEESGISQNNLISYHLQTLIKFNYVRCVDHIYYPKRGGKVKKPLLAEIHSAISTGAKNPSQVARKLGYSRGRITYHMKKNGLLNREKKKKKQTQAG